VIVLSRARDSIRAGLTDVVERMRRYIAETIGTFALVFAGTGAVVIDDLTHAVTHVGVALTFGLVVLAGDPVDALYVRPLQAARPDWPVVHIHRAGHLNAFLKDQFKQELARWLDRRRQAVSADAPTSASAARSTG